MEGAVWEGTLPLWLGLGPGPALLARGRVVWLGTASRRTKSQPGAGGWAKPYPRPNQSFVEGFTPCQAGRLPGNPAKHPPSSFLRSRPAFRESCPQPGGEKKQINFKG